MRELALEHAAGGPGDEAYAHGLALALPEKVAVARPTGFGRALATYEMRIEGRDEWLASVERLA